MTDEQRAALRYEDPVRVEREEARQQAGFPIIVGNCPRCGQQMAVNQPGRRPCTCGQMLQFGESK